MDLVKLKLKSETSARAPFLAVLVWGGLWGIFEATAGYLLHLLPFSLGWLIWYPVACFFIINVYRRTGRVGDIVLVGLLAACIKLLNLFMPIRIDRVLNPAVSIVMEPLPWLWLPPGSGIIRAQAEELYRPKPWPFCA